MARFRPIVMLTLLAIKLQVQGRWVKLKSCDFVEGLSSHSMVGHKDSLYIFGGMFPNGTESDLLMEYNTTTNLWTLIKAKGPSARRFHAATVDKVGNAMYIIGGDFRTEFTKDFWKFDFITRNWTLLSSNADLNTGHGAEVYYGEVVLFGGYTRALQNGSSFGKMIRGSENSTLTWRDVGFSGKQHSVECTNKMAIRSGRMYVLPSSDETAHQCDLSNDGWTSLVTHKKAKSLVGHTLNGDFDRLIVFGGFRDYKFQNDLLIYYINVGIWEEVAKDMKTPPKRFLHSGAILNHALYIFGGQLEFGQFSKQLYKFQL